MQDVKEKGAAQGGLRERKKRATRAALAEAAVRLAAEHGAEKVTVEAISAAAGVSVRTFFNYFDTRDDAFVVIDADAGARIRRSVREAPVSLSGAGKPCATPWRGNSPRPSSTPPPGRLKRPRGFFF
ncbi:LOW QUALITY PROTEIN: TetR family transcriptional regulator, partial [Streptomyces griseoflavus Tu4000]